MGQSQALVVALLVVGFAGGAAHAQVGPVRDHRVAFQYGSAEGRGYQTAEIGTMYRFGICDGEIKLQMKFVPTSLSTSTAYYYNQSVRQAPARTKYERSTLDVSGQAVLGGRILHSFQIYVWAIDYGGICLGTTVGKLSDHLDKASRAKPREVEAFLSSLSITTQILPALTNRDVERAFDHEDKAREQEARENEQREKEEAARRAAAELEARRRREAEERETRLRKEQQERDRQAQQERDRAQAEDRRGEEDEKRKAEELLKQQAEQRERDYEQAEAAARAADVAAKRRAAEQRAAEERKRSEERDAEARRARDAEQRAREDAARRERATRANVEVRISSPEALKSLRWFRENRTQATRRVNSVVYTVEAFFSLEGIMWLRTYDGQERYESVRWNAIESIARVADSDRIYVGYITRSGDQSFEYVTPATGATADEVMSHLLVVAESVATTPIKGTQMTLRDADQVYLEQQLAASQAPVSPMTAGAVQAMDDIIAMTDGGPFPKVWELALSYEQRGGVVGGGLTVRRGGLVYAAIGLNYFEMPPVDLTVTETGKEIANASGVGWSRTAIEGGFGFSIPLGRWGLIRGEGLMYVAMGSVESNPTIAEVTVDEASFAMLGFNFGAHLSFRPRSSPVGVAVFARAHSSGRWGFREIDRQTLSDFRTRELTMSEIDWYTTFGVALVFGD